MADDTARDMSGCIKESERSVLIMSVYKNMTIKELVEARNELNKRDAEYQRRLSVIEYELERRTIVC